MVAGPSDIDNDDVESLFSGVQISFGVSGGDDVVVS